PDPEMLLVVRNAINEGVPNLARAREIAPVIAIAPNAPTPAPRRCVEESIRAHRERFHPARERAFVVRLDDQMNVIVLDRELDDVEVVPPRRAKRALERLVKTLTPKARQPPHRAHRHMQRIPPLVHRPRPMPNRRPHRRLPPPLLSPPLQVLEREL